MAFGAVATGNINAQDAEMVAGIINSSKEMLLVLAAAASIGSTKVLVARLEFTSVKKVMLTQISSMTK